MTHSFEARYFDGQSSRYHQVQVSITNEGPAAERCVTLTGDNISARFPLKKTTFSERTRNGPRRLFFPDDSFAEATDPTRFDQVRQAIGQHDSLVVHLQQYWLLTLAGLVILCGILFSSYQWGLPWVARQAAPHIPAEVTAMIGKQGLEFLEKTGLISPSKLPLKRQAELEAAFAAANQAAHPDGKIPPYRLEFRSSIIGPNAFALPGNIILVTDEITRLIKDNDDGLIGVMAHELGHLHYNHVMEQLISSSVIGTVTLLVFGDSSTLIATLSASALQANYSRQAETEADEYALNFMRQAQIPPARMADMFRALEKAHAEEEEEAENSDSGKNNTSSDYFSTHPATPERIRRFEEG